MVREQSEALSAAVASPRRSGIEYLTLRAYARRRGVSHTAVQKAIKVGRLNRCLRKKAKGKGVLIDPAIADQEWEELTDQAQQRDVHGGGRPPAELPDPGPLFTGTPVVPPTKEKIAEADEGAGPEFQRWRGEREKHQAKLKEIELHERLGQAGDLSVLERETQMLWRKLRDRLLEGLPDDLAPRIAPIADAKEIHSILVREIRKVLDEFVAREASEQRA